MLATWVFSMMDNSVRTDETVSSRKKFINQFPPPTIMLGKVKESAGAGSGVS